VIEALLGLKAKGAVPWRTTTRPRRCGSAIGRFDLEGEIAVEAPAVSSRSEPVRKHYSVRPG
jgi:hypothetical protein